jgi:hypothetical protein
MLWFESLSSMDSPSRIAKLHRCGGCGRWVANLAAHASCVPIPLSVPRSNLGLDLQHKPAAAPWRAPVKFTRHSTTKRTSITLECGHVVQRNTQALTKSRPKRLRCDECARVESSNEPSSPETCE